MYDYPQPWGLELNLILYTPYINTPTICIILTRYGVQWYPRGAVARG